MRVEIEDYFGNTLMSFEVAKDIELKDISNLEECGIADLEEFGKVGLVLRIQSDNIKLKVVE